MQIIMKILFIIAVVIKFTYCLNNVPSEDKINDQPQMDKREKSFQFGVISKKTEELNGVTKLGEFMEEQELSELLHRFPDLIEYIFIVSSILTSDDFYSGSKSEEKSVLSKKFLSLNQIFDKWDVEFAELKYIVQWENFQTQIRQVGSVIQNLRTSIQQTSLNPGQNKKYTSDFFVKKYEGNYKASEGLLYTALISSDDQTNVLQQFMIESKFDRKKLQDFMVTMVKLLSQSMYVEAVFTSFKYSKDRTFVENVKSSWITKISALKQKIELIDTDCKDQYSLQYQKDLDNILETRSTLNNHQFTAVLHNILSKKYYWRQWFVVTYKELYGFKDHTVMTCQGTHRFRSHGRNVIVSSVDNSEGDIARSHLDRNKDIIGNYNDWNSEKDYAKGWINYFHHLIPLCSEADTRLAIKANSDMSFVETDLVVHKINCVNNKSPCYDTFLFA